MDEHKTNIREEITAAKNELMGSYCTFIKNKEYERAYQILKHLELLNHIVELK
jgi:hypothetical protein